MDPEALMRLVLKTYPPFPELVAGIAVGYRAAKTGGPGRPPHGLPDLHIDHEVGPGSRFPRAHGHPVGLKGRSAMAEIELQERLIDHDGPASPRDAERATDQEDVGLLQPVEHPDSAGQPLASREAARDPA